MLRVGLEQVVEIVDQRIASSAQQPSATLPSEPSANRIGMVQIDGVPRAHINRAIVYDASRRL